MPLVRRTLAVAALAAVAACSDSTGPIMTRAAVTVPAPSLTATSVTGGAVTWIRFSVPVHIENTGFVTLMYSPCFERVDVRTGDTWAAAWTPDCAATEWIPLEIPPGESRDVDVQVQAAVSGPGGPQWLAAPGASEYRFVALLGLPAVKGRIPEFVSNSFTLVGGN